MLTSARPRIGHNSQRIASPPVGYAITFDLDTKVLDTSYPHPSWQNAYADIGEFLRKRGFARQQGSVCFGDETIDVVRCQMTVQQLTLEFDWFAPSMRDIRMLRTEENNDLMPAVEFARQMQAGPKKSAKK
jgi:virulence-associated protein VapD